MALILLIRHGMTDVAGKQLSGWTPGIQLNSQGRNEVRSLGEELRTVPLSAVYASPLERTVETAEALAGQHGLKVITRDRVGEIQYGDWTGLWGPDVENDPAWRHWNTHRAESRCPNGESMLDVQARVVDEILAISRDHPDQIVAVVSHGDPIRSAVAYFLGVSLDMVLRIEIDPASVSAIRIEDWGVKVLCVNRRPGFDLKIG
jgi:probable phosphomutase (TIGR03848 family)